MKIAALSLAWFSACTSEGSDTSPDTSDTSDTADTGDTASADDADGDGVLTADDCDDADPAVTAATERRIPEGIFVRGHDDIPDASPAREIFVSTFCLDVYEVTNAQFAAFMNAQAQAGLVNQDAEGQPLFDFEDADDDVPERILDGGDGTYTVQPGYEDHPVTEVYHWSGEAFCGALGKRLPTEAEWEKAASGPEKWTWPWGEAMMDCSLANIRPGPEGLDPEGNEIPPCVDDTTPVGTYTTAPGPYGHYDLGGNVAEWVHDWYQEHYYGESPDTDPQGPDTGWSTSFPEGPAEARVTRGGSFASSGLSVQTMSRYVERPYGTSNGVGFRCARSQP